MRGLRFRHHFVASCTLLLLRLIIKTCRLRVKGLEHFEKCIDDGSTILSFWHDSMALIPPVFSRYCLKTKFVACVSNSRDGDWLDAIVSRFPSTSSIRIGHKKRAVGLLEMIREVEKGGRTLLLTPDGPKGPPKALKEGVLEVARKTGAPILPLSWKGNFTFQLPTWDRFRIPLPFSKIEVVISPPTHSYSQVAKGMNYHFSTTEHTETAEKKKEREVF